MTVKVSVGVPAYNEEETIQQLLEAILNQALSGATLEEIIVETSGSTDATNVRVMKMIQVDPRIRLISAGVRKGKSAALNTILQNAKGDVVVFIDGDVVLEEGCIPILIRPLLGGGRVGVASGNVMPMTKGDEFFAFTSRFIRELHHELCAYLMRRNSVPKVNGTFYAIRRTVVTRFPFSVVSDDEYASWRAQSKGYGVTYVPDAVVYARDPASYRGFIRWQKRILAGQMFIKRHFGYTVPTMRASTLLPVALKSIRKHWRKAPHILTMASLALVSLILALQSFLRGIIPYMYD